MLLQLEVRHILLAAAPADGAVRATAQEQAKHLIDELCAEPSRFDQLARDFSACPSGQSGGNLGQIGPGQTVPEFERALLSAANRAGTPTLAPFSGGEAAPAGEKSFAGEVAEMVRRYPLPAVALGAGVMFLLARRRR